MSYVAVHVHRQLSLATDELVLPPDQVQAFDDARDLAAALATLRDAEEARIAAAEQAARAAGHASGYAQGEREGRLMVQEQGAAELARTLPRLLDHAEAQQAQLREAVVGLALLVVRRVAAGMAREDLLTALAHQALDHLYREAAGGGVGSSQALDCVVRLNPTLLPLVQQRLEAVAASVPGRVQWRGDDTLAPLDCVVDTPGGRLLAGLETQLARVQSALVQAARSTTAEEVNE